MSIRNFILFVFSICLFFNHSLKAQSVDAKLANEYFIKHDYEKAYDFYKKLIKKPADRNYIYQNYLVTAKKLNETNDAIKQLEKLCQEEPNNYEFFVDKIILLKETNKNQQAETELKLLLDKTKQYKIETLKLANILQLRKMNNEAIQLFLDAREEQKAPNDYSLELATAYKNAGMKKEMMDEWIILLEQDGNKQEIIQVDISNYLTTREEQDQFLDKLFVKVSQKDAKIQFNEMMVWMYMQRKDFYNAYIQMRSIDKKVPYFRGTGLIELGDVAMKNKDYTNAITIFNYVTENYPNEIHFDETKKKLIHSKEIQVKEKYPIDTVAVNSIIQDYELLLQKSKNTTVTAEILISQAELYGVFLNKTAIAKEKLNLIEKDLRQSLRKKAEAKTLFADILLLEGQTGEALLQYMQVERMIEDDDLGHTAKLKTAKVSYYEGEFEMAQQHLEILKKATTRKIANDAMDLSLLIKGNYDLDTTDEPMMWYANTELLIIRHKYSEAMNQLDSIEKKYPNHSLKEEICYQKAQIYLKTNRFAEASEQFKIVSDDKECILSDDATYELALLYDYKLKNPAQAKEYYKKILIDFPGSIYVAEARKRYYEI
jgi:predicted Zn-dependent protease